MDLRNTPDGAIAESGDWEDLRDAAADQMTSTAKHALEGCIFGLTPNAAQTHVQPGEAYVDGNRLRLRADEAIDIAGLTRPTGSMVAWVTVLASYATETSGTVTDDAGVQYVRLTNDSIIITLARGANAASEAAAVKPSIPNGSIVLCDILLDRTTAVGSLDGDPSRRPQCPDDDLQRNRRRTVGDAHRRAAGDTGAASLQTPTRDRRHRPHRPTRWRSWRRGRQVRCRAARRPSTLPLPMAAGWRELEHGRTFTLATCGPTRSRCPTRTTTCRCRWPPATATASARGPTSGTIDAADIEAPPALMARTFTADDGPGAWPYPQSTRAHA